MSDKPLSTREAGVIAGRHQRTIVSWIHKGLLKARKYPGLRGPYLIKEEDLHETIKELYTPQPYEPGGDHETGGQ